MASKKRRFTTTKTKRRRSTVKIHDSLEKKNIVEEQTQKQEAPQQNPKALQTPVVESGFPQANAPVGSTVTTQAYRQPQPIQPQSQSEPTTVKPTIISPMSPNPTPSPVSSETQGTAQPSSPDAKSGIVLQESVGSRMNTSVKLNESTSIPPQDLEPQKKSKSWIVLVVILVMLAAVGGALYYFRTKAVKEIAKEEKFTLSPTQSQVTPTVYPATESAKLKVDYSKYEIRVLNGSGITGEASRVKDSLEEEKFVVKNIDNADASDYGKTVIKAKKDVSKEYLDKLKKQIEKKYVLDMEEELTESADVDVVIIIGNKKE
ncbi:MAG: LytR C-terminal domain-containing protein [Patescibacteria group bacterium]